VSKQIKKFEVELKSRFKLVTLFTIILGLSIIAYLTVILEGRDYYQYAIGIVTTLILSGVFNKRIATALKIEKGQIEAEYYFQFRKHVYIAQLSELTIDFKEQLITPVSTARKLLFFNTNGDLQFYLSTELFLWDDSTIESVNQYILDLKEK
jgi:hypothetical protein